MSLSLRAVSVRTAGRALLHRVSLEVEEGMVLGVLGPNGAGKSTLLKVASSELTPSSGEVQIFGKALDSWLLRQLAQRRAVLPQHASLSFGFTVFEVVLLGRLPHERGAARNAEVAQSALAAVGCEHLASRGYPSLSGGEQKRVHLARVLAQIWDTQEPCVLLMDEPTAALDMVHQHRALQLARKMARRRVAVITVLHDLNLAAAYCDRLALLHQGELVTVGAPSEVLRPSILEPVYGLPIEVIELSSPKQRIVISRATTSQEEF